MSHLLALALHWLVRHALALLVIMLALIATQWLHARIGRLDAARTELVVVQRQLAVLDGEPVRIVAWIDTLLPASANLATSADAMRARAAEAREQRERERASTLTRHPLASRVPGSDAHLAVARLGIEIDLLQRAERHLQAQALLVASLRDVKAARARLETARDKSSEAIDANLAARRALWARHTVLREIPGSAVWREIERLDDDRRALHRNIAALDGQARRLDTAERLARDATGAWRTTQADVLRLASSARTQLAQRATELGASIDANPWRRITEEFGSVLAPALLILLAAISIGPLFKAFAFFVVAPLAARRPPMRLLPGASGEVRADASPTRSGKVSGSSLPVRLEAGEELLVHASFLQSRPTTTPVTTQVFLDPTRPFTSLAADMALVQRVLPDAAGAVLLSSTQQDLLALAALELPADSAFVLRPRALAGLVQRRDRPVRISSHWRFSSLHSWLDLQFRYLAFHGPVRLIVKGSRGVILESAAQGRVVNQAGVLGWSAGLERASTRCDSFAAYLFGEQDLFNDRFLGDGFIVYEEMPGAGAARSLIFGKGLPGLADSAFKVFGI